MQKHNPSSVSDFDARIQKPVFWDHLFHLPCLWTCVKNIRYSQKIKAILKSWFYNIIHLIVNLTDAADKIRLGSTLSDTCKWSDIIIAALRIAVDDVQKILFKNF